MPKRQRWDMPDDVWQALQDHQLTKQYQQRPPYQQNDYVGWINQARLDKTRQKRIDQMISEIQSGDTYMNMPWGIKAVAQKPSAKPETIDAYIADSGELFGEVIRALDACLMSIQPKFSTKAAWGGWAYKINVNYSCMIVRYKDHVKLMIWRGKMLKDPKNVLQGAGSNTLHLRIHRADDIDCEYLKELLQQQFALYGSGVNWED